MTAEPVLRVVDLLPPVDVRKYRELFRTMSEAIGPLGEPRPPRVLGTRRMARELVSLLPLGKVTLDFDGIEVMSTPFAHEILSLRPTIEVTGMNEEVAASWNASAGALSSAPQPTEGNQ